MRTYKTQMEAAKRGIVTPEMELVAKKEYMEPETLRQLVAKVVAIPCWHPPPPFPRRASAEDSAPRSTSTWASPATATATTWRCRRWTWPCNLAQKTIVT